MKNKSYLISLCILLLLFSFRVTAQLTQYFFQVSWLPDFDKWHSGTLPYPLLVIAQCIILFLYGQTIYRIAKGTIILDFVRGKRFVFLGSVYASIMIIRYSLKMWIFPSERWFGGCIPIFFHIVLASFIIITGIYHLKNASEKKVLQSGFTKFSWRVLYAIIFLGIPVWLLYQLLPTILANQIGLRDAQYAVFIKKQVGVKMPDGEVLYADIYNPENLNPAPTILVRIPLDNNIKGMMMSNIVGRLWAERGYNVVIQGIRGRFHSTGKHIPFIYERSDGIATLKWLNQQPWHNGKTGMWGGSYFGYTQWVLSDQDILGLKALLTQISSSSNYSMFYPGGAFSFESALFWATRSYSTVDTPFPYAELKKGYDKPPMIRADEYVVTEIPFYKDWVTHTGFDTYWKSVDGIDRSKRLKVPALMMAGWYDPFLRSQIQDYENIIHYADLTIRNECRLIIGPWSHAETKVMPDGYEDMNYRLASIAPSIDWYDKQLKGVNVPKSLPVKIFVMGINQWRYEETFPLARTIYTSYYLNRADKLSVQCPEGAIVQKYLYDPANPVPSIGGAILGERAGPKRQNELKKRSDILFYESDPLKENVEVTGKIKLILYVSTNVVNTDFTAKLIDVYPDGSEYNISEGILRTSFYGKDVVKKIEIELNPTSNAFLKGHKIQLAISSSNYPKYSLNYNTGGLNYNETKGIIAEQKIYSGKSYCSELILPVIPSR